MGPEAVIRLLGVRWERAHGSGAARLPSVMVHGRVVDLTCYLLPESAQKGRPAVPNDERRHVGARGVSQAVRAGGAEK